MNKKLYKLKKYFQSRNLSKYSNEIDIIALGSANNEFHAKKYLVYF